MFDVIAFDADDTLWHSERLYVAAQDRVKELLAPYKDAEEVDRTLLKIESGNIALYGYGIKGFALSLIETAITLSEGRVTGADIQQMLDLAKGMLNARIELIDQVETTVTRLASEYPLMLITKGDYFDQEMKLNRSGLKSYFRHVAIVSEKTPAVYAGLLDEHGIDPSRFLMVGNSLRSDILPVLELGGRAVHIPYHVTWAHEIVEPPAGAKGRFFELDTIGELPALLESLNGSGGTPPTR